MGYFTEIGMDIAERERERERESNTLAMENFPDPSLAVGAVQRRPGFFVYRKNFYN